MYNQVGLRKGAEMKTTDKAQMKRGSADAAAATAPPPFTIKN